MSYSHFKSPPCKQVLTYLNWPTLKNQNFSIEDTGSKFIFKKGIKCISLRQIQVSASEHRQANWTSPGSNFPLNHQNNWTITKVKLSWSFFYEVYAIGEGQRKHIPIMPLFAIVNYVDDIIFPVYSTYSKIYLIVSVSNLR